jgi:hypothetical protein
VSTAIGTGVILSSAMPWAATSVHLAALHEHVVGARQHDLVQQEAAERGSAGTSISCRRAAPRWRAQSICPSDCRYDSQ